ncbi:oxygen-dependent tRNA uridine(34) hydroxylase TrhO [Coxiella endosymbiont of Amblyomma nuttalli]|uniref:oxygen-dependent tRNA uridine(34) hydroxylase TrhO n=1 Tax=Coxiella endosymbiont of Amblyomma nuttalli TaxID=2749996 RepID=UPI001BA7F5AE|nr:rhodanese-like domain-containing protein [Coxiella endosymbiont of Amblyomma nuttalli]QTS83644.1 Thiosulfate sulfurtransferase GlpE [Coxiella endosymbiont of Amblyomma nuttalli]
MEIINIAAYKFLTLKNELLTVLQSQLREGALVSHLKGTILLSTEGINLMIAGERKNVDRYKQFLSCIQTLGDLVYKETLSASYPFAKLVVQIKREIVTMRCADIHPEKETAPHISPEMFRRYYQQKQNMVILDTRNDFEVTMGTFENAINLHLRSFSDFPKAIDQLPESFKNECILTFCTGGIRCEKASALMIKKGFKKVYQLDGGILHYYEKCGSNYFKGKCFVFDKRIAITAD